MSYALGEGNVVVRISKRRSQPEFLVLLRRSRINEKGWGRRKLAKFAGRGAEGVGYEKRMRAGILFEGEKEQREKD